MNDLAHDSTLKKPRASQKFHIGLWQKRLLPLMATMLVGLTILFFISGYIQFQFMQSLIDQSPQLEVESLLSPPVTDPEQTWFKTHGIDYLRWKTLSAMEAHALQHRYHQAKIFLMSRIWTRFLGFVTGMTLALMGAAFILGKLREPQSEMRMEHSSASFSMLTTSPGLILSVLGTVLMITAMLSTSDIRVKDQAVYTVLPTLYEMASEESETGSANLNSIGAIEESKQSLKEQLGIGE